jgi:hypothetical protein
MTHHPIAAKRAKPLAHLAEASGLHRADYTGHHHRPVYNRIAAHLYRLMRRGGKAAGSCFFLPSVMSLSKALNCPSVEVHAAMAGMKRKGYVFFTLSLDSPVTASAPSKTTAMLTHF